MSHPRQSEAAYVHASFLCKVIAGALASLTAGELHALAVICSRPDGTTSVDLERVAQSKSSRSHHINRLCKLNLITRHHSKRPGTPAQPWLILKPRRSAFELLKIQPPEGLEP